MGCKVQNDPYGVQQAAQQEIRAVKLAEFFFLLKYYKNLNYIR